jgi:formate dehydrogenase major subunit
MTNGWVDMKNTDMMLIMGGNPAENHPCGFKWPIEAKRTRGAKMISVDPRFTRTSAVADLFCQIRAGTDIAFLGGVIRYAIENNRMAKDYLVNFTRAPAVARILTQLHPMHWGKPLMAQIHPHLHCRKKSNTI